MLTQQRLKELITYDPASGEFRRPDGKIAGTLKKGYRRIKVDYVEYRAARLAFLYMTGEWPKQQVDHVSGVRSDDRWVNLRDVDRRTNLENRRRARAGNPTGLLGVCAQKSGRFGATICANGTRRWLGVYETPNEAHAAYLSAKRQLHEGCTL